MLHRRYICRTSFALIVLGASGLALANTELRVMVHSSFSLPRPLLVQFELQTGVKLVVIKGGDAGEMLNKLILTKASPLADVVFGIDNTLMAKAIGAGVLDETLPAELQDARLPGKALSAVDYGYVTINYDKATLAAGSLALPSSLHDLTQAAFKGWLVTPNPATSSTGYAFLLATIAGMGEEKAFDWWARMRANGLKVTKGWSEAYYTEFARNKGKYPLVVSYATSPAAEVFYSKTPIAEPPTGSLHLPAGVFRQTEGMGLIKGGSQREAALKFVGFMRSDAAQQALQTTMWMYPAKPATALAPVMKHAQEPVSFEQLEPTQIAEKGAQWVARWTRVVLK